MVRLTSGLRYLAALLLAAFSEPLACAPAAAIPVFAHRFGFRCQVCHTTIPTLNEVGRRFLSSGYRLPGVHERPDFPLAVKVNLAYSSAPDPSGLPKAIVDEIELLTGGHAGSSVSYFAETYVVDGGRPGAVRDLWVQYDTAPGSLTRSPFAPALRIGQFTLPLPVDPETFRETENHYALYDQTVGANPFDFFDPHAGAQLTFGLAGTSSVSVLALPGHDKQSGIPSLGTDFMAYAEHALGPLELSAYRYQGARPIGLGRDAFWRQGYGLGAVAGKLGVVNVLQTGNDADAGFGQPEFSSGGFSEWRYAFSSAWTLVARYDGTQAGGALLRSTTASLVRRLATNSRLTLEDVIAHGTHTLNAALLFAY